MFKFKEKISSFLTNIDIASDDVTKAVPYFFNEGDKVAGETRQPDLSYGSGLLLTNGADTQANGYFFKKDLIIKDYKSVLLKPINIEHQQSMLVGSIYDVALAKRPKDSNRYNIADQIINPEDLYLDKKENKWRVRDYSGDIDMWVGFLIYKYIFPEINEYVIQHKMSLANSSIDNYYQLGLSMELWYADYGYLFDLDESTFENRNIDNAYLDDYIGRKYNGKKVYKVYLDDLLFGAAALTETAAEKRSFLLDVANKSSQKDTEVLSLYNATEDLKDLTTVELNPDLYNSKLNMTKELFTSLKDAAAEEHDENLVKEISSLDLAVRAKKEEGQTDKYKDVPVSRFAEPASYKYPLNTPSRVQASVMYFSQHGTKYTEEEQKAVWGQILKAAAKFELSILDKVVGKDQSSQKSKQEVANMEELLKQLKAQFGAFAEQLKDMAKNNTLDEASVKNLLATEKLNTIIADLGAKEAQLKDIAAANEEMTTKISDLEAVNETLTTEKADLASQIEGKDKEIEDLKAKSEEDGKKLETAASSIVEFEKEGLVKSRLTALKAAGVSVDESRVESVVEKASAYSQEDWDKYVENLKDVASKSEEKKKDTSSQATSLLDIGKNILSGTQENNTNKDNSSAPGSPDGSDDKSLVNGFEKNFSGKKTKKTQE